MSKFDGNFPLIFGIIWGYRNSKILRFYVNFKKILKQKILRKFFLHFENKLRKYVIEKFKIWCQVNFTTILRNYAVEFPLTFRNNSRNKGFENFEYICMFSEILKKFKENFRKILKRKILKKFFLYFGNSLRK